MTAELERFQAVRSNIRELKPRRRIQSVQMGPGRNETILEASSKSVFNPNLGLVESSIGVTDRRVHSKGVPADVVTNKIYLLEDGRLVAGAEFGTDVSIEVEGGVVYKREMDPVPIPENKQTMAIEWIFDAVQRAIAEVSDQ